ncbi:MAG TPA: class I SAM-dependent methyltransferase [Burkholderiales bacterium]|nr:class I SAM-dependent methyltransferase [Burkholderiales bacterium]
MIHALLAALALALSPPLLAQHGEQHMHKRFDNAEKWSKIFDDPARDAWQKPAEVISALKLPPDAVVADIGSGTGYFAVRLARAVPKGKVYGADVEPDMVKFLNDRAARENLANLSSHAAGDNGPNLPAQVDLALVVDTYHHIPRRSRYFEQLKAALRPGGRIAIIDFRLDSPTGPPVEHRIPPEQVKAEMERAGYRLAEQPDFLPHQYFLVFTAR